MGNGFICSQCGYVGVSNQVTKGSTLIEIVLWLCFLVPGLIYSIWRRSGKQAACLKCGGSTLIPLDSPVGKKMLESQGKTDDEIKKDIKQSVADKNKAYWSPGRIVLAVILSVLVLLFFANF